MPSDFPLSIKNPESYYDGVDPSNRVICRNVIVFERLTRKALQQQQVSNRMHHRYVLVRVLQTAGVVSVDGQSFHLNEGDALLVTPFQFHHFIDSESESLRWLIITFDLSQGHSTLARLSYRRLQADTQTHKLWCEVVHLWLSEDSATQSEMIPVLDRMLMRLHTKADDSGPEHTTGQDSGSDWIVKIETLIIRSVKEAWTFSEVANQAGISVRHLRSRFEQQMGMSLSAYRDNYQFHMAISLMRDSKCNLSEVAELSGFNSQSVFTRFIRRMSGKPPRELCREIRSGQFRME
jgi:AraC-like DNA-binding protein